MGPSEEAVRVDRTFVHVGKSEFRRMHMSPNMFRKLARIGLGLACALVMSATLPGCIISCRTPCKCAHTPCCKKCCPDKCKKDCPKDCQKPCCKKPCKEKAAKEMEEK
jgi:hypothetical protein